MKITGLAALLFLLMLAAAALADGGSHRYDLSDGELDYIQKLQQNQPYAGRSTLMTIYEFNNLPVRRADTSRLIPSERLPKWDGWWDEIGKDDDPWWDRVGQ